MTLFRHLARAGLLAGSMLCGAAHADMLKKDAPCLAEICLGEAYSDLSKVTWVSDGLTYLPKQRGNALVAHVLEPQRSELADGKMGVQYFFATNGQQPTRLYIKPDALATFAKAKVCRFTKLSLQTRDVDGQLITVSFAPYTEQGSHAATLRVTDIVKQIRQPGSPDDEATLKRDFAQRYGEYAASEEYYATLTLPLHQLVLSLDRYGETQAKLDGTFRKQAGCENQLPVL